jgi:antibiotic biosynthesis monooxygenase (ABM) superfamily enzyme
LDLIKSQSIRGINKKWKISVCVILTLLPWVPNFFKSQTLSSQKQKLDFILRDHKNIATYLHEITDDIAAGKKELHESTNKNHERYTQLKKVHGYLELDSEKYLEAERVEESLIARIDRIEELIQKNDRKQMEQK